ncbi:MAG TPA: DUF6714 family protein [Terracidiphilus sp.]|jgi:hypothetical protein
MSLIEKIELAFAHRQMPAKVVDMEGRFQVDSDVEAALWFEGRGWREITTTDWEQHSCAVFFLSDEAFAYYLPSLLILTIKDPEGCPDLAVDSFVGLLDRTPDVKGWDLPFTNKFLGFRREECEALKEWLLFACEIVSLKGYGISDGGPGDKFGRAFENVSLLQQETELRHLNRDSGAK